jgi:hypothetical protein
VEIPTLVTTPGIFVWDAQTDPDIDYLRLRLVHERCVQAQLGMPEAFDCSALHCVERLDELRTAVRVDVVVASVYGDSDDLGLDVGKVPWRWSPRQSSS